MAGDTKLTVRKIVDQLKKKNPDIRKLGILGDEGVQQIQEVLSTSSLAMDYRIKYGGFPRGKIIHIYGPERSLKTTIALKAGLDGLQKDPNNFLVFVDFERNYDTIQSLEHLKYLGFTDEMLTERFIYIRDVPEICFNTVEDLIQYPNCVAVIVDSVGGMLSGRTFDKGFEENKKMGQQPSLISDLVKRLNDRNNNAAIILLNQARDNMNKVGHGPEYIYSGGRTLKHLIHLSLDVKGYHQKLDKDKESANAKVSLSMRIDKCKTGGENAKTQVEFDLRTGEFNRPLDCIIIGYQLGIMKNSGSWYTMFDGVNGGSGEVLFKKQGGEAFEKEIMQTPELWHHIENLILQEKSNTSTINWAEVEAEYEEPIVELEDNIGDEIIQ